MEDAGPLVVAGRDRAEHLQSVDRPLHFVALAVDLWVEPGRTAAVASWALAVGPLVPGLGNGVAEALLPGDLVSADAVPVFQSDPGQVAALQAAASISW